MARNTAHRFRDTYAPIFLLLADALVAFAGLSLGYWIRYVSPLSRWGIDVPNARYSDYLPLLLLGTTLLVVTFAYRGLYDSRLLLRRYQSLNLIIKATAFWLVAYLGVSLVLKFTPPISRLFVVVAFVFVLACMFAWRTLAHRLLLAVSNRVGLQRRTALLGWNANASSLLADLTRDPAHPYTAVGVITLPGDVIPQQERHLGSVDQLRGILEEEQIDLLIATRVDLKRLDLHQIIETCEHAYVEWKIVPAAFEIFLSGLRLQTVGKTPVLGIEELAITRLFNRILKRLVDVLGALVGLVISAPVIAVIAYLIKRESPEGPVFFRQIRVGGTHRKFDLFKLRSMRPDAAEIDSARQSTAKADPRLLKIGRFIRRWNLDELPQFWNVLKGDMSLVGPRPERPYHVDQLSTAIPHYLPRHLAKPGMTGWAQVHGLRGETSIELRIQYDIYYIENWSLWLDIQILLLTFIRWRNQVE
jgi:exopolysaccharide biosynthesis polyprenyl glycosylphosphotransferase